MDKIKASNLFLWAGVLGLVTTSLPYFLGIWFPIMYGILALTILSFAIWGHYHQKELKEFFLSSSFFSNSTHLLAIIIALVAVIGINFLATKYNRSYDITSDKINTLSKESLKIVKGLDQKTAIKVYYTENSPAQIRLMLKKLFFLYEKESPQIKSEFLNAKWEPSAAEYLTKDDQDQLVVYVENSKGKEMVAEPISEETITTAMIRLNSSVKYRAYFTTGHGEKGLEDDSPSGLLSLKKDLNSRGIESVPLSLLNLKNGEMPSDLYALVIAGPVKPFSAQELNILKAYIEDGGKIILAVDPEHMNQFNELTKRYGVEFKNHFVVSVQSLMPLFVLGSEFSKSSEITSEFLNSQVLFPISGSIQTNLKETPKNVEVETLVSTNEYAFAANSPTEVQKSLQQINEQGQMQGQNFALAVLINGKNQEAEEHLHAGHSHGAQFKKGNPFSIIAIADSDFLSNEHIQQFYNKDFILNSVIYLTGQKDLISIRPNQAKATPIEITSMGLNIGALMSFFPCLFFSVLAFVFWFRKRSM